MIQNIYVTETRPTSLVVRQKDNCRSGKQRKNLFLLAALQQVEIGAPIGCERNCYLSRSWKGHYQTCTCRGHWGQCFPNEKRLSEFFPQKNYLTGDLDKKIRFLSLQIDCKSQFCPQDISSSYMLGHYSS